MRPEQVQETQPDFSARSPAQTGRRRDLAFAGGTAAVVLVLGCAGIFGWQKLSEKSARATVAPPTATTISRPQLPGPLNGVNPLPCSGDSKSPIKLKGHTLPLCPPGTQSSGPRSATPAAGNALH